VHCFRDGFPSHVAEYIHVSVDKSGFLHIAERAGIAMLQDSGFEMHLTKGRVISRVSLPDTDVTS
jgi:hypothetical protein